MSMMSPIQLGFGVQLGAEAAVHAATRYLEELGCGQLSILKSWTSLRFSHLLQRLYIRFVRGLLYRPVMLLL